MNSTKEEMLSLMKFLTATLAGLKEEQYKKVLSGEAHLVYKEKTVKKQLKPTFDENEGKRYISAVMELQSREEAIEYLRRLKLSKAVLVGLCNQLEIHVLKSNTREQLIIKLVESALGSRLRSEAIRTADLKGNKGTEPG